MKTAPLLAALVLAGCAGTNPAATADVRSLDDDTLCAAYRYDTAGLLFGEAQLKERHPEFRAELERRGLISDWRLVDEHKVSVGMTRCELLASWGQPYEVNRASYGDQWVYCRGGGAYCTPRQYVYLRGNRVTAWN